MRALLLLPVVLLACCGEDRPSVGDTCDTRGAVRCGLAGETPAVVRCSRETSEWTVASPDPSLCAAGCEDVEVDTVQCGGVRYGEVPTDCVGNDTVCDYTRTQVLGCTVNGRRLKQECRESACGMKPNGYAICL